MQVREADNSNPYRTEMGPRVYITISRLKSIVNVIPSQSLDDISGRLYERPMYMFSSLERIRLLATRAFFEDSDKRFKRPLKKLLSSYYRVRYNPDLAFDGYLLERLGFRCWRAWRRDMANFRHR